MAIPNPSDSTEILYGASGDVRDEINAHALATAAGHYIDEIEMPGALVIRAMRKATRTINSYLEPVYADQIPFTVTGDVPKMLDEISTDLATFYCLRSLTAALGPVTEDKKRDYFDQYMGEPNGILAQIRDRKLQLSELTAQYADDAKTVLSEDVAPIFDVDNPLNWQVDPRRLDDIDRERS